MKAWVHYSLIVVPVFVVGAIAGALGGVRVYEKANGSMADVFASRAIEHAYLLNRLDGTPRSTDEVVAEVIANANQWTVHAGGALEAQTPQAVRTYRRAMRHLHADPRMDEAEQTATDQYAHAVRACVIEHSEADVAATVACATRENEAIRARYCVDRNGFSECSFPTRRISDNGLAPRDHLAAQ